MSIRTGEISALSWAAHLFGTREMKRRPPLAVATLRSLGVRPQQVADPCRDAPPHAHAAEGPGKSVSIDGDSSQTRRGAPPADPRPLLQTAPWSQCRGGWRARARRRLGVSRGTRLHSRTVRRQAVCGSVMERYPAVQVALPRRCGRRGEQAPIQLVFPHLVKNSKQRHRRGGCAPSG